MEFLVTGARVARQTCACVWHCVVVTFRWVVALLRLSAASAWRCLNNQPIKLNKNANANRVKRWRNALLLLLIAIYICVHVCMCVCVCVSAFFYFYWYWYW